MADRYHFGKLGSDYVFRISKPGQSVYSSDFSDFIIREDSDTYKPVIQGSHAFAGVGNHDVSFSPALAKIPFVVLKSSDGHVPSPEDYFATVNFARTRLRIRNNLAIARTISWFVFIN